MLLPMSFLCSIKINVTFIDAKKGEEDRLYIFHKACYENRMPACKVDE